MALLDIVQRIQFCSCGNPDAHLQTIQMGLELHKGEDKDGKLLKWINDNPVVGWFLLYCLESWGLTEHGSNIGFGWLTQDGEELLMFLRQIKCNHHEWEVVNETTHTTPII
jgi:hypothetical protein